MRTNLTLILSSIALIGSAQCVHSIPNNATVVTQDPATGTFSSQSVWVCGIQGAFAGQQSTYYIESGAFVAINGDNNTVYSKSNTLFLGGNNNTVFVQGSTGLVTDNGTGNTVASCPSMTFIYTAAPTPGCSVVGIEETLALANVSIYPTLTLGFVNVEANGADLEQVVVMDVMGRTVMTVPGRGITGIDLGHLNNGTYYMQLLSEEGKRVERITLY